jgi:hypothetical protein
MAYLLLAIAVVVALFGVMKASRNAQPGHSVPWGQLLIWAALFGGGLSIWLLSVRVP